MTMRGATAALVLVPALALAHGGAPPTPATLGDARVLEPGVVVPLGLTAICWLAGVIALWRDAGAGRGVRATEAASFVAGWVVLAIALASPLHPLGRAVFSAHMTQHELLMLVAAPLLVAGRPLVPFLHGLPRSWRAPLARFFRRRPLASAWDALTHPLVAWAVHALTLWAWHAPRLYTAAVAHEGVHAAQHASFLAGALLFWWSLLRRRGRWAGTGAAVLYLFTTSLHAGALGAILTFAPRPLYPGYVATAASWGL
ncbi:MAG TPA: cytochrome c oxidase assembly protein, partial [Candidatus Binatia bacterium]|nr:cytochrome c oxidase assembly protein [Candidatus Binatia bacterium]